MRYYINQNSQISETQVSPNIVKKVYDDIVKNEAIGDFYSNDTNLIGSIQLSSPTYQKYVEKINNVFPNLEIFGEFYILFQDDNIKNIMVQYLSSKGVGDGIGITINNAKDKLITSLPSLENNTNIEYFNELFYFERITSLLDSNFRECTNLKEIDLSNITTLNGASVFQDCSNLQKVILGPIRTITSNCFQNCTNLENIINSENITTVGEAGFRGCLSLENINLSNITSIGGAAFANCSNLKQVDLSKCITIDGNAFENCTLLTIKNNTLNAAITVGAHVFEGCSNIEEINLPNCTSIGNSLFTGSQSLETISMPNITVIPSETFGGCTNLVNIDLSNIQSIGVYAFHSCKLLQSVYLTNIVNIDFEGFKNCTNLTLSNSNLNNCTTIGNNAFESTRITNINLPNLTSLGANTFGDCKQLQSISIPLITEIKNNTFYGCSALASIDLSKCVNIGYRAFFGCVSLNNIDLSNVETIGQGAFENIGGNMNIKKNDKGYIDMTKIKSLDMGAFNGFYDKITNNYPIIDLGGNLTSVDSATFKWTKANFICRNTEVPTHNAGTPFFTTYHWSENINERTGVIYVLDNMVDAFKEVWSGEASKIHPLSEIEP